MRDGLRETRVSMNYPLILQPVLKEKVWGGDDLYPLLGLPGTPEKTIGEAWVIYEGNRVENGPLQGRTVADLVVENARAVLGAELINRGVKEFPLLAKFLDARENLSVQDHPDDRYARAKEGVPYGKAEFWYVLKTEPGAQIIHGTKRKVTRAQLERDLRQGDIEGSLEVVRVEPGDVVLNMPGTVHALGGGLVIYELQQSSDVTYRLYDWGREKGPNARELHLDRGLDVANLVPLQSHTITPIDERRGEISVKILCACHYFAAELVDLTSDAVLERSLTKFDAWTILCGDLTFSTSESAVPAHQGQSLLIPAAAGSYTVTASSPAQAVRGYVPDLQRDILEPLSALGIPRTRIEQLAGENGAAEFEAP
jgi:mannose-6-phosphate isomerase